MLDEGTPDQRVNRDCIPDFVDGSPTAAAVWNDPINQKGMGFTVVRSYWSNSAGGAAADFANGSAFRQLADRSAGESPVWIAGTDARTDFNLYDICFRLTPDAMNHAGTYTNIITYYITANF
jgi:hypothetical protein